MDDRLAEGLALGLVALAEKRPLLTSTTVLLVQWQIGFEIMLIPDLELISGDRRDIAI